MTKCFSILEILIKKGLARFSCLQDSVWNKARSYLPQAGENYLITLYMFFKKCTANDWCSSKLKLTPAQCFLENYLQHPKKATSLKYIQNGMILTFWCTKWHGSHLTTCAKKHKKLWKSWKGNTALTNYVLLMQCKFVTVLFITSNIFGET